MIEFDESNMIFIDFDGVIVDSNNFKEIAIEKSILQVLGKTKKAFAAIDFFNINAGISRKKKLAKFFKENIVSEIMHYYAIECGIYFERALPTIGLLEFLNFIKSNKKKINLFILSGGEKDEIEFFLNKHSLLNYFEDILTSEKNKITHLIEKKA